MEALFDFLPIVLFFLAFKLWGIYAATIVAIFATLLQTAFVWIRAKKVSPLLITSLVAVIILGGATILLKNEAFIKWKPTAVYLIFAAILWISEKVWNKNLIKSAIGEKIKFPENIWRKINASWVAFFVFLGAANVLALSFLSTEGWVNFKLFGLTGFLVTFSVIQSITFSKYVERGDKQAPLQNQK